LYHLKSNGGTITEVRCCNKKERRYCKDAAAKAASRQRLNPTKLYTDTGWMASFVNRLTHGKGHTEAQNLPSPPKQ